MRGGMINLDGPMGVKGLQKKPIQKMMLHNRLMLGCILMATIAGTLWQISTSNKYSFLEARGMSVVAKAVTVQTSVRCLWQRVRPEALTIRPQVGWAAP